MPPKQALYISCRLVGDDVRSQTVRMMEARAVGIRRRQQPAAQIDIPGLPQQPARAGWLILRDHLAAVPTVTGRHATLDAHQRLVARAVAISRQRRAAAAEHLHQPAGRVVAILLLCAAGVNDGVGLIACRGIISPLVSQRSFHFQNLGRQE